jgi:hypothetical protein
VRRLDTYYQLVDTDLVTGSTIDLSSHSVEVGGTYLDRLRPGCGADRRTRALLPQPLRPELHRRLMRH